MKDKYLERESDPPANWVSNVIMCRDGRGNIVEVAVPDDEEVADDDSDD